MTMRDSPWFPFDVLAWRSSRRVQLMDPTTRGLYLELLIEQWDHGVAPPTPEACADMIGFDVEVWRASWRQLASCFVEKRDAMINPRLDRIQKERVAFIAQQRERGRLGGQAPRKPVSGNGREPTLSKRLAKGKPKG